MLVVILRRTLASETCELKGFRVFRREELINIWKSSTFNVHASTTRQHSGYPCGPGRRARIPLLSKQMSPNLGRFALLTNQQMKKRPKKRTVCCPKASQKESASTVPATVSAHRLSCTRHWHERPSLPPTSNGTVVACSHREPAISVLLCVFPSLSARPRSLI